MSGLFPRSATRLRDRIRGGAPSSHTPAAHPPPPRSLLILAPDRPEDFIQVVNLSAEAVVIDCFRDGVVEPDLALIWACARALVVSRGAATYPQLWLRIHPAFSQECEYELDQLTGIGEGLILPQVRSAEDIEWVVDRAPGVRVLPVVENHYALNRVGAIAKHPAVCRLGFSARGFATTAAGAGQVLTPQEALVWQRRIVVSATASARLPGPVNGVHGSGTAAFDAETFAQEVDQAGDAGFTGHCVTDLAQLVHLQAQLRIDAATD
ncbi:hypothetical protein [Streptomyces sp. NPDC048527]|uniref:hypothetical protein n=1 Tax=Streptomyces sp. NPDC048527 TaxID=3365568 RepID=UPI00371B5328